MTKFHVKPPRAEEMDICLNIQDMIDLATTPIYGKNF